MDIFFDFLLTISFFVAIIIKKISPIILIDEKSLNAVFINYFYNSELDNSSISCYYMGVNVSVRRMIYVLIVFIIDC